MTIGDFQVTELGVIVYTIWIISSIWIIIKKQHKLLGIIFPLSAFAEGIFIDWRWGRINEFQGLFQVIFGGMPSFLLAVGFPFIGYYLHYLFPKSFRTYFSDSHSFPFSASNEFEVSCIVKYYKIGLVYSLSTLFLHELSQLFNLSKRNTFDLFDLFAILIGSIVSAVIYYNIKIKYRV